MALPTSVDLTSKFPPVYDQGPLGSCTGNAIAGVIQFEPKKQNLNSFTPSRLFIDYNERVLGHAVNSDSGAQIGDGMKSSLSWECCPRRTSHTTSLSSPLSRPPVRFAMRPRRCGQEQVTSYQRVTRSLSPFKGCLASGYPFVFGFTVYASFESTRVAQTGPASMPPPNEQVAGGHAVMAVGYDDRTRRCEFRGAKSRTLRFS